MELLVKDILDRPHFQHAEVLVGKKGLHRIIKWVHVVEIDTFGHLLHGQEMILTTGIGWLNDKDKSLFYLQQLIDNNASVLCIELDENTKKVPDEMLALAEEHDFPIILFHKEVKFIDITKDIHKVLLGYQENVWWDLENLYKKMNQNLVTNGSIENFLKILHQGTNKQIALIHSNQQSWFFPSPPKNLQAKWMKQINENVFFSTPIYFLNEWIANLYIIENNNDITLFDQFAANRCGEFLTQYFWKFHQQIEIQKAKKNEWIIDAISGQLPKETIIENIRKGSTVKVQEAIIGVIPNTDNVLPKKINDSFLTGTLMTIRSIFENNGFHLLASKHKDNNCYVLFLINQLDSLSLYNRLKRSLRLFNDADTIIFATDSTKWLSFGKPVSDYAQLPLAYQTALSTLEYQQNIESLAEPFYYSLTTFRLIDQMRDRNELHDIIDDYLGTLLKYDEEKGTELLKTLQIYLKNLGAKNQTADELFIVRQTLYHRLDRISELLGKDFMEPKKRIMIEFAIYALEYLEKKALH